MELDDLILLSRRILATKNQPYHRQCIAFDQLKHRMLVFIGQRGVGKTTFIIQYLLSLVDNDINSNKIIYIPTDHFLMGNKSIYEIAEKFSQLGGKIIAFDEIHKYKTWSNELKSIYDTFDLKIIVSGSSALEIAKGSHDLARRAAVYNIPGLSFLEYLELNLGVELQSYKLAEIIQNHEKIVPIIKKVIENKNSKILAEFKQYLETGYYPYFRKLQDKNTFYLTLEQNLHTTIESDLGAIYPSLTGHSIRKIQQLLIFIAKMVPFTPNWNNLKNLLEISDARTLKTYFKYLEDAGLIRTVMKSSKKIHKLEMPEKVYLDNPNQIYALSLQVSNIGTIREVFFLDMLTYLHEVTVPKNGDFLIDDRTTFAIGGKNKNFYQLQNINNAYLACDDLENGIGNKIPLWLFGFLY